MNISKKGISVFLCSLLTYFFFSFSVTRNFIHFFPDSGEALLNTCLFFALLWLYNKTMPILTRSENKGLSVLGGLIALCFSAISVLGVFYEAGTIGPVLFAEDPSNIWRTFILVLGGFIFFYTIMKLIGAFREKKEIPALRKYTWFTKLNHFLYGKNCFLKALGILTLCWLPQILIRYPGALTRDLLNSLRQYLGTIAMTTQHPIIYTELAGKLMDFGFSIDYAAAGLFLLVLMQTVVMLLILAYTIYTLKKLNVPEWFITFSLAFFAFTPIFISYATTAIFDTFYCSFFLLLGDELACYLFDHDKFRRTWYHYVIVAIAVFGLHVRHNGSIIVMLVAFFAIFMEISFLLKKQTKLICSVLFFAVLLIPSICAGNLSDALYGKYDTTYVSTRVMFSLPIQQTARCLATHGDQISDESFSQIHRVLKWEKEDYAENYNPLNFDGVKRGFSPAATKEDLLAFIKEWLKLVIEYPRTCINATINQNYILFSPLTSNQHYYTGVEPERHINGYDLTSLHSKNDFLKEIDKGLLQGYYTFGKMPFLGLLVNQGVYSLLLLTICLYALFERNGKLLLLGLPLLLTLAITFVGPAVYSHPRYTYPIMYTMPLLWGIYIAGHKPSRNAR